MLTYLHTFNQLKMILNAKPNYSKTEKYGTKTIISVLNYYHFFDYFKLVTVEDEGYKKLYFIKRQ